ncbi:hypothetical protein HDU87_005268 [Geranomyces variabilis]|uniref:Uncharacterized protein n=1 Tax=Geranomyces variabilis TaxID=109894 RepID=A0AAD5TH50_9FUNG|nr:hypothetical protein HDU87_005268 [Geranomyces variabilis]
MAATGDAQATAARVSLRSAALTLLNALENLLLLDEHGHARPTLTGLPRSPSVNPDAGGSKRRGSERVMPLHQVQHQHQQQQQQQQQVAADGMDVDSHEEKPRLSPLSGQQLSGLQEAVSPLKRKRAASGFPLPDAKAHRVSASLSSRMQRSLQVGDERLPEQDVHTALWPSDVSGRRLSRLPMSDSSLSIGDELTALPSPSSSSSRDLFASTYTASRSHSPPTLSGASSISAWIESLAAQSHRPLAQIQASWEEKRVELECNLTLLANGVPSDSYQDLRSITENIVSTAKWLSAGNLDELGEMVPLWKTAEPNIELLIQYIRVVEDLKTTAAMSFPLTGNLDADAERMKACLDEKKQLWGTILADDGRVWRTLGFPVDEHSHLFASAAAWIYGLPWTLLVLVDGERHKLQARGEHVTGDGEAPSPELTDLMERVFKALLFAQECGEFVGRPFQPRVRHGACALGAAFFVFTVALFEKLSSQSTLRNGSAAATEPARMEWSPALTTSTASHAATVSQTPSPPTRTSRATDARVMQLFGNLVRLLDALRVTNAEEPLQSTDEDTRNTQQRISRGTPDLVDRYAPSAHQHPHHLLEHNSDTSTAGTPPPSTANASPLPLDDPHLEALDKLARVVVEAGLQICEHVAARLAARGGGRSDAAIARSGAGRNVSGSGATGITATAISSATTGIRAGGGGKNALLLALAARYVVAAADLAGLAGQERVRLQSLREALPVGSFA